MFVAKVTGSLVSTQKVETMKGYKLLIVEPYRVDPAEAEEPRHDRPHVRGRRYARRGRRRLRAADARLERRMTPETKNMPIDAVIIGIVDQVHVDQQSVYAREK